MQLEDSRPRWGIVTIIFLLLLAFASLPFLFYQFQPKDLPTYEVQNFIGKVEIYSAQAKAWLPAKRGETIRVNDKIRTAPGAEIDIRVPDQIRIRIKESSEAVIKKPNLLDRALRYRLHLLRGSLLGSTDKKFKGKRLEVSTPVLVAAVRGTTFQIEMNPENRESAVRVLEGTVKVKSFRGLKTVTVRSLEKTEIKGKTPLSKPIRVSRQEWNKLKEGYELFEKSAAVEARQLDLSKQAGNLFHYVFDHGTFYTPNFGFADREFIREEGTGKVYLKISYDVFPTGSFVGMYIKIRDFDLARFKSVEFQVRGEPEEGYPDSVKIEMKSGTGVVRAFVPRDFKQTWQSFQFPLRFSRATSLSEVTIVFANEKAGDHKKGSLYFRDFTLVPQDKPLPGTAPAQAPAPPESKAKASPRAGTTRPS